MPDVKFWQQRFTELGEHSVGPGDTVSEAELEEHRLVFLRKVQPFLSQLKGPVLDFGCGVGRWVMDLPRPYLGLDLTPEHVEICKAKLFPQRDVDFRLSEDLKLLPDKSFKSIFTITVLQHIVEPDLRKEILRHFRRVLSDDGVFLSVEWAEGQREYDWCKGVKHNEYKSFFNVQKVGIVDHVGRLHDVWLGGTQKRTILISLERLLGAKT